MDLSSHLPPPQNRAGTADTEQHQQHRSTRQATEAGRAPPVLCKRSTRTIALIEVVSPCKQPSKHCSSLGSLSPSPCLVLHTEAQRGWGHSSTHPAPIGCCRPPSPGVPWDPCASQQQGPGSPHSTAQHGECWAHTVPHSSAATSDGGSSDPGQESQPCHLLSNMH